MVPAMQLAQQQHSGAGAALPAVVGAAAVPVIEPEAILAPAQGTGTMPVDEEPVGDTEPRQDLTPAATGTVYRAVGHRAAPFFSIALA
ncbi:hypothetical protein ABIE65_001018 [Constrictibacter sp. MBR-5]|jgi:hypothetical protein